MGLEILGLSVLGLRRRTAVQERFIEELLSGLLIRHVANSVGHEAKDSFSKGFSQEMVFLSRVI